VKKIFHVIEDASSTKQPSNSILTTIIEHIKALIDVIRHSLVP
jgi:hypothetical protein